MTLPTDPEILSPEERTATEDRFPRQSRPPVDADFDDGQLSPHELATAFPPMEPEAFDELVEDICKNGVHTPVTLYEGRILDGLHRWKACRRLTIECPTIEFTGTDPVAFVLSVNLHRRHLSTAQRAVIAANIATLKRGSNQHPQNCGPTVADTAKALNVSERSVTSAKRVLDKGADELVEAMRSGAVPLAEAERIAKLPKPQQRVALKAREKGVAATNTNDAPPPPSAKKVRAPKIQIDYGGHIAIQAISVLDQLRDDDKSFRSALEQVRAYCEKRLGSRKLQGTA